MKAIRIIKPGEIGLYEEEIPTPKKDEVLCKVKRVGICGTDYGIYMGEFSEIVNFPLRPGHEWSGIVERVGENVTHLKPGDRVVGESGISCGMCDECSKLNKLGCEDTRSVGTVNAWDGAMCEYELFPARDLIRLPQTIDFDQAALIEPAANAIMAVDNAPVHAGDTVCVMGTGPIGLAAVALSKIYGAQKVISVGRSDFKLEMSRTLGATHTINTAKDDVRSCIADITHGKGTDISIEVSGALGLLNDCLYTTKCGGTVSILAFYNEPDTINYNDIVFRRLTIKTAGGGWGYFDKVVRLMADGQLDLHTLITSRTTLDEAASEIAQLKKNNAEKVKVMICMD